MLQKYERKIDNVLSTGDIFCYFYLINFFRFTKLFAKLLPGKSLPYAQNCPEFNGNHKTTGISRTDVGQLEDGLRGCGIYASWGGSNGHAVRNDRFKGSCFLAVRFS